MTTRSLKELESRDTNNIAALQASVADMGAEASVLSGNLLDVVS